MSALTLHIPVDVYIRHKFWCTYNTVDVYTRHSHRLLLCTLFTWNKMVQPLLQLDKLWSQASTSVGGLPVAIALPVLEAVSLVLTM